MRRIIMSDVIIVAVIALLGLISLRGCVKHFKGQGGCCGGGSSIKPEKKKLEGKKIAEKVITIEGMHCENCKNSVEKHINRMEGAAVQVNLKKHIAVVSMDRKISDGDLKKAVEEAGFKVTDIQIKEA